MVLDAVRLQPAQVEVFEARTFWRWAIGNTHPPSTRQAIRKLQCRAAAHRPSLSYGNGPLAANPGVEQCISGSRIESDYLPVVTRQYGDIGNTAEVENDAMNARGAKKPIVKRRHEWSTLAPRRNVKRAGSQPRLLYRFRPQWSLDRQLVEKTVAR